MAVTLLLQGRVEYSAVALRDARAVRPAPVVRHRRSRNTTRSFLHAKVAVIDDNWATVGSSNIDPYSLLMAREANVFVRDPYFSDQLRDELREDDRRRRAARRPAALGAAAARLQGARVDGLRRRAPRHGSARLRRATSGSASAGAYGSRDEPAA